MKTNRIIQILVLAVFCLVSCQKEDAVPYLGLSVERYTFMGKDNTVLKVVVSSNNPWNVEEVPEWVETKVNGDTLEVSVLANTSVDQRNATLSVVSSDLVCGLEVSQLPDRFNGRFEDMYYLSKDAAMSRNGQYVCGIKSRMDSNGNGFYTPVIINTRTGEQKELDELTGFDGVLAISDDASLISLRGSSGANSLLLKDGKPVDIALPEGYQYPFVSGMSADGSIMVGFCKNANVTGYKPYVPVKWVDGVPEIMAYPDHTVWGDEYLMDTMARGCSSDGEIVFGSEWTDYGLVYWKGDELFFPGQDYADLDNRTTVVTESSRFNISHNGKYVGGFWKNANGGATPAVIDTENNELIMLDGVGDGSCIHVTDEGTAFCCSPSIGSAEGYVVDVRSGETKEFSTWMKDSYGLNLSQNRFVEQVSEDGKTLFGLTALTGPLGTAYVAWYCYVGE